MLFCGDVLRKGSGQTFSSFAVSFDCWFHCLKNGGRKTTSTRELNNAEAGLVSCVEQFLASCQGQNKTPFQREENVEKAGNVTSTVSFVQICRNSFRSNSFCESKRLEYMYRAGIGCYAYRNCKALDIEASIKVVGDDSQVTYHPLLVSVKNCAKVTTRDVGIWVAKMKSFLNEVRKDEKTTSVCIILLLGCSNPPQITKDGFDSSSLMPFPANDVFRLVCVADNDEFGVSDAIRKLNAGLDRSEVYSSHAFIPGEPSSKNLLRKSADSDVKEKVTALFRAFDTVTKD